MSSSIQISAETVERLRDEAYAEICRQAFTRELEHLLESKEKLEQTRPPFGFLGTKKTLEAFEKSRRATEQSIATIRENALLLSRIEAWLAGRSKEGLDRYLAEASPDQQVYNRIVVRVDRWQAAVSSLRDNVLAFARDVKAVTQGESDERTFSQRVAELRATTLLLHTALGKPRALAEEVASLLTSVRLPTSARLPALPNFREEVWVEHILVMGFTKSAKELT